MTIDTCANCGEKIGKLEAPNVWREQVVCAACHTKLTRVGPAHAVPIDGRPPDDAALYVMAEAKLAAEEAAERARSPEVSIVRIIGMFILLGGALVTCVFWPAGLAIMAFGAVLVFTGR